MRKLFLSIACVAGLISAQESRASEAGDDANAKHMTPLVGVIKKRLGWGAPGFGETPKIDGRVVYYVLHLDRPRTSKQLSVDDSDDGGNVRYRDVQLSCDDDSFPKCNSTLRRLVGAKVTIVGDVSGAQYPSDYLPIVVNVHLIQKE